MRLTKDIIIRKVSDKLKSVGFVYDSDYDLFIYDSNTTVSRSKLNVSIISINSMQATIRFEAKRYNNQVHMTTSLVIDVECYRDCDVYNMFSFDSINKVIDYIISYSTCKNIAL